MTAFSFSDLRIKSMQIKSERPLIVILSGAGLSAESGIPTYRNADNNWNRTDSMDSVDMKHRPQLVFDSINRRIEAYDQAKPNAAHLALAKLEQEGKLKAIVTQNIDGLHQKAGSRCVYELHGSIWRNRCQRCGKQYPPEFIRDYKGVPHCDCGGLIKPEVVLYEEGLDEARIDGAIRAISRADILIVGGTSLTVYPAAGLIRYYGGSRLVLINRDETQYDSYADLIFRDPIGTVLSQVV